MDFFTVPSQLSIKRSCPEVNRSDHIFRVICCSADLGKASTDFYFSKVCLTFTFGQSLSCSLKFRPQLSQLHLIG